MSYPKSAQSKGGHSIPGRKVFYCEEYGERYEAAWTKGKCKKCSRKVCNSRNYKSPADPYSTRADLRTPDSEDGEWMPVLFFKEKSREAQNYHVRRHYQQLMRECKHYGVNYDDFR